MADRRDAIMAAVMARFAAIRTANGYYSNLGQNVFEWRAKAVDPVSGAGYVPTEQGELPALHVRDVLDEAEAADLAGNEDHDLSLEIEIAHEGGASGAVMRGQIQDVRKAIGVDPAWGGLALGTAQKASAETVRIQADRTFFRTLIRYTVTYTTSAYGEE
jgi:hypothetical protein